MVVIEGKIDVMATPVESEEAAQQREIDSDFLTEPLKEIEDVKALEQTLLDVDKYYQLVKSFLNLFIFKITISNFVYGINCSSLGGDYS